MKSADTPISRLSTLDQSGHVNVIIESAKGNRNKFKYDASLGLYRVSKVLPAGAVFPFDFGFVPGTLGEDGDPLDVLVLMDEPAFTGCLVPSRLVGVIEAEEQEGSQTKRNDRLIAVAAASKDHADLESLKEISPQLRQEIEYFFASYNRIEGKEWTPLGVYGPKRAQAAIERGVDAAKKGTAALADSKPDGRPKTAQKAK